MTDSAAMWAGLTPPYSTIVADPPWPYRAARIPTRGKKQRAGVADHYSMMTMRDIIDLPVADLAADAAHLYLWVTNPVLLDGQKELMSAWGFRYVTCLTWFKRGPLGLGFHFRINTEHVLFGVRGKLPIPPEKRERNFFEAAKTGHSRKPPVFYDLVERVSPRPYVELFARAPRLGWDSWGYGFESERTAV